MIHFSNNREIQKLEQGLDIYMYVKIQNTKQGAVRKKKKKIGVTYVPVLRSLKGCSLCLFLLGFGSRTVCSLLAPDHSSPHSRTDKIHHHPLVDSILKQKK